MVRMFVGSGLREDNRSWMTVKLLHSLRGLLYAVRRSRGRDRIIGVSFSSPVELPALRDPPSHALVMIATPPEAFGRATLAAYEPYVGVLDAKRGGKG